MLTVLYTFFIAPLEALMTAVLGAAHELIGSYGWSVAVMSLVVNTLILPIYNKAESWQEEERRIKKGFEATEAMIKRTFKGQERFAMLTTMRRQHGYSARLALRSSLGFFLQIPFFIAAYHLLSNMPELRGVAFGPITDLGAADGLIKLGGFSINVLPLLMTAVNLLSAFVYTASLSKQDKIQLYGLSALFLVLLYASPAALTLYWTLNNVYSLGKNIVEKSLLPAWRAKHADRTGSAPDAAEGAASAPSKGFAWVLGSGVLLLLYAVWDTNGLWKNTIGLGGIPDAGRLEAFLMMLALSTSLISEGLRRVPAAERWVFMSRAGQILALLNVLYPAVLCTGVFGITAEWYLAPKDPPAAVWACAGSAVLTLVLGFFSILSDKVFAPLSRFYREGMRTATVALLVLGVAVMLVGLPALVLTSDPDSVSTTFDVVMPLFVLAMLFAAVFTGILCRGLPKGAAVAAFATALFLDLALAAYAFLLVGDYGLINGGELEKTQPLYDAMNVWKDVGALLTLAAVSVFAVKRLSTRTVRDFSSLLTVLVFGLSALMLAPLAGGVPAKAVQTEKPVPPASSKDLFTFSATGKNLLVVVFDMYTADHFLRILEERPELKAAFEGFTWYRDTTAAGSGTLHALAVTAGGNRFSVSGINRDNEGKTFEQLYGESYDLIPSLLGETWDRAVIGSMWPSPKPLAYPNIGYAELMDGWFDYYYRETFEDAKSRDRADAFGRLLSISIFKAAPYSLRGKVYANGRWLASAKETLDGFKAYAAVRPWADFSRVVPSGDVYRYVYSDGSHTGRYIGEDGLPSLVKPDTPSAWKRENPVIDFSHYLSERAFTERLADWLNWMRVNGVFDNTRIVVTADHGGRDSVTLLEGIGRVPYKGRIDEDVDNPGIRYPLLLVKDFGGKGEMKVSDEPMTNGDVPDLILAGVRELPVKYRSGVGDADRVRFYDSCSDANLAQESMSCFVYGIRGDMFEKSSWSLEGR